MPKGAAPKEETVEAVKAQINRSNLLIYLLDVPARLLSAWERGFIAALTMDEKSVDHQIATLVERVA